MQVTINTDTFEEFEHALTKAIAQATSRGEMSAEGATEGLRPVAMRDYRDDLLVAIEDAADNAEDDYICSIVNDLIESYPAEVIAPEMSVVS